MKSAKEYKHELLQSFKRWLADFISRHGYTQAEAAARLGTTAATINMVLKGTRGVSDELMKKILLNSGETPPFDLEAGALFTRAPAGETGDLPPEAMRERGFFTVPFSEDMRLAAGSQHAVPFTHTAEESRIVVHGPSLGRRTARNLQAFRVGGSSMEPLIADGGIVLADTTHTDLRRIREGRIYVLCWDLSDGECAVKFLRWAEKGRILSVESENPLNKPVFKRADEVVLIGKVIWAWREFED